MKGTRHTFGVFLIILVLTALFVIAAEEPPLKNDEISKLTNRHRETGIIIKIKAAKAVRFDTSTDEI